MPIHLNVVIDVGSHYLPFRHLVWFCGQAAAKPGRSVSANRRGPSAFAFAEGPVIESLPAASSIAWLSSASEKNLLVPERGQNPALHDPDSVFDFGFVAWLCKAGQAARRCDNAPPSPDRCDSDPVHTGTLAGRRCVDYPAPATGSRRRRRQRCEHGSQSSSPGSGSGWLAQTCTCWRPARPQRLRPERLGLFWRS